jgi:long-chain acyl-CoA synthetase
MDRFWLKSYPQGVPADVDTNGYDSLVAMIEESFVKFRDRTAYVCMGRTMTYGEIDKYSRDLSAYLVGLGLRQGDRVAIMMPNVLQYPIAAAAVLRAGFIAVNVNPLYTPRELEHQMKDSGAKAIVILENFANTLQQVVARTRIEHIVLASMGDLLGFVKGAIVNFVVRRKMVPPFSLPKAVPFNKALAEGAGRTFTRPGFKKDDTAVLQYTGGTTGLAKGASLSHGAILSAVIAADYWLQPALKRKPVDDGGVYVCALPLYHVYAFVNCSLAATRSGGSCILIPNPRDIPGLVKELGKHTFHYFPGVNTLFNALVHNPEFAKLDFSKFVASIGGGAAVQETVARRWAEITGVPIVEGYGLSETCSGITCNPADIKEFTGTVGLPMPGVEIRIGDDDGVSVPLGQPGEVLIRAPQVMTGYWGQPEETKKAMTADGFFKSGDIGIMDERGYLRIVDRKKDMILVSGFNVYPNEVEAVAAEHPGVLECAAVGTPDQRTGEAVQLYVVRKDPNLTADALKAFLKSQLTAYKMPQRIEFRDALPKTNVGKILRRELRDEAIKEMNVS